MNPQAWTTQQQTDWMSQSLARVEQALDAWVPAQSPAQLGEVMRYAVLDGGKRLRPLLVLGVLQAAQQPVTSAALRAACAVELIHAYSLVHDDLPCMDNDVLRRGKPTVHVKHGEAQALLAGDALQALAFDLLVPDDGSVPPNLAMQLTRLLTRAAGLHGMAGGQAIDLASVGQTLQQPQLENMHRLKTGALLKGSVLMGAACANLPEPAVQALAAFGAHLGLAFQVVDDVLDVTADTQTLGKTAGKDADNDKPTFVSLLGLTGAQAYAQQVLDAGHAALQQAQLPQPQVLALLLDWVGRRQH